MKLKVGYITLVLVLLAGIVAGCGTAVTTSESDTNAVSVEGGSGEAGTGSVLVESYEGALPASSQLALGTLQLQDTENAVTAEQAEALLPSWQIVQSGALQSETETGAVLTQIEGAMTAEQLSAIAAMQLTFEDMGAWAREQGLSLGAAGDGAGGLNLPEGVTEEERDAMRAAREAGGLPEGVSEEDRDARRATAEASGMIRPNSGGGTGSGQLASLAGSLVELLTRTAAG